MLQAAAVADAAGLFEVRQAAEADHLGDLHRSFGVQRAPRGQVLPRREPQGEVPARGVPGRHDAAGVQPVAPRVSSHGVGRRGNVKEGAGVSAARAVDTAIFDVPDRHPALAQVLRCPVHQIASRDFGLPAAAVHHQDCGMGCAAIRQPDIDNLEGVGAVA
jgi:hypothetical protein